MLAFHVAHLNCKAILLSKLCEFTVFAILSFWSGLDFVAIYGSEGAVALGHVFSRRFFPRFQGFLLEMTRFANRMVELWSKKHAAFEFFW